MRRVLSTDVKSGSLYPRRKELPLLMQSAWSEGSATRIVDETELPERVKFLTLRTTKEVAEAIHELKTRGAGQMHASLASLCMEAGNESRTSPAKLRHRLIKAGALLKSARPTNRQFVYAIDRVLTAVENSTDDVQQIRKVVAKEAREILDEYIAYKVGIAEFAAKVLHDGDNLLTHCNASGEMSLIYTRAKNQGKRIHFFVSETRPFLQGLRLTAYELSEANAPATVVVDSAVGYLMSQKKIDCVIVGSDVITTDGYVVNKIGTYQIARLAKIHGIPFYVYGGKFDYKASEFARQQPLLEDRPPAELFTFLNFKPPTKSVTFSNPAFDITPPELITAIISPIGLIPPQTFGHTIEREEELVVNA